MNEVEQEREAKRRLRQLLELDPYRAQRQELLQAGVASRTVRRLYPGLFSEISDSLLPHIKPDALASVTDVLPVNELVSVMNRMAPNVPPAVAGVISAQHGSPDHAAEQKRLAERIRECMPDSFEQASQLESTCNILAFMTFYSFTYMTELDHFEVKAPACKLFLGITDLLLPDLDNRVVE